MSTTQIESASIASSVNDEIVDETLLVESGIDSVIQEEATNPIDHEQDDEKSSSSESEGDDSSESSVEEVIVEQPKRRLNMIGRRRPAVVDEPTVTVAKPAAETEISISAPKAVPEPSKEVATSSNDVVPERNVVKGSLAEKMAARRAEKLKEETKAATPVAAPTRTGGLFANRRAAKKEEVIPVFKTFTERALKESMVSVLESLVPTVASIKALPKEDLEGIHNVLGLTLGMERHSTTSPDDDGTYFLEIDSKSAFTHVCLLNEGEAESLDGLVIGTKPIATKSLEYASMDSFVLLTFNLHKMCKDNVSALYELFCKFDDCLE